MNRKCNGSGSTLYEAFQGKPTSVISDNMDRLPGPVGLRYFIPGSDCWTALTVRTRASTIRPSTRR